ncbi:MAG: CYTH domain-containing protein [Bacilli bacterium]|jgi:uncharacterized protein YjbK|nr:CYTH domain-containing protein [Bacilli bacterium]MDD3389352.1 CYTH domain-containing protein [Bacilli bacterium]MDD4344880.1 CYTH domain-containing protein [Bacilli bacterium]MDD4521244.1 CYTH domain-containing protein [Bacilli bacterium]MDY0399906.1 CYTH domain-containing protein [Bacilli bacterium]
MSSNIEIEVKVLLSLADFEKVKKVMKADEYPLIKQTNHYIDTNRSQLRKYGMALRVREIDKEYTLTLKSPLAEGLLEKNQNLSGAEFEALKMSSIFPEGDIKIFLIGLGVQVAKLQVLTSLTTHRISRPYQDCLFSMDENYFDHQVDYELEMEGTSVANAEIQMQEICKKAHVPFIRNTKSKQARAMNALKSRKK